MVERGRSIWEGWAALAAKPWHATLALAGLCLLVYVPGVLRLPAVDRTEIVWAESTRDMVARGDWKDPRYGDVVQQYRPIGTFWAQGTALTVAGEAHARDIRVYRVPALITVTLAVIAVFWLGAGLVGAEAALIAAALFAVAPLTVLVSQLAIAEGLSLLPATVAMLVLARFYTAQEAAPHPNPLPVSDGEREASSGPLPASAERGLALLFWIAVGAGVLINALLVPILVVVTLAALFAFDRDLSWLKRLRPVIGVPIALAIASPWLIVRAHQDGTAFAGLGWHDLLAALGGAQDMKLRAFPGTFVLALLVGFLPGTALLGSAAVKLWGSREAALSRFLLAWVIGYLVYLEALSSKPGTYMVQTMFPALALAVASVVVAETGSGKRVAWSAFPWPTALAAFPLAVFGVVYVFAGRLPSIGSAFAILLIVWLFILSGQQGREGRLRRWAMTGVAALGLLAVTLLGGVLPSIDKMWPARQLQRAIARCGERDIGLVGFREPSGRFVLGVPPERQNPESVAANPTPRLLAVEDRWRKRTNAAFEAKSSALPAPSACVRAFNVMRGCPLLFRVYEVGESPPCTFPRRYSCEGEAARADGEKHGDCD